MSRTPKRLIYRNQLYVLASAKKLIIMRGVSGSGKSTLAQSLKDGGEVFSTDEFFYNKDKYDFDPTQLGNAHQWNQMRAFHAMQQGVTPVIIDNTNVRAWEARPYVEEGIKNGYQVEIVEPTSPWWRSFRPGLSDDELWQLAEIMASKNSHGVPAQGIFRMLSNWEHNLKVDDILRAERPF